MDVEAEKQAKVTIDQAKPKEGSERKGAFSLSASAWQCSSSDLASSHSFPPDSILEVALISPSWTPYITFHAILLDHEHALVLLPATIPSSFNRPTPPYPRPISLDSTSAEST